MCHPLMSHIISSNMILRLSRSSVGRTTNHSKSTGQMEGRILLKEIVSLIDLSMYRIINNISKKQLLEMITLKRTKKFVKSLQITELNNTICKMIISMALMIKNLPMELLDIQCQSNIINISRYQQISIWHKEKRWEISRRCRWVIIGIWAPPTSWNQKMIFMVFVVSMATLIQLWSGPATWLNQSKIKLNASEDLCKLI